ncbi:MAG TPA: pinensin family lanthipeptide [Longimicrobium sp.]|nr:pinensin family lanthipeptide [Longimicrobium sp.]
MRKKLKLEIDMLKVESFTPSAPQGERGTVRGNEGTLECTYEHTCAYDYTCGGGNSCYPTCQQVETCLDFC